MEIRKIWLVNKYAMPPMYESRLRTIKFAHYLSQMGYEVTIFGCSIMHNLNMDLIEDNSLYIVQQYEDLKFVHVRSSHYQKTGGFKRLLSEIVFHYNVVKVANNFDTPDLIIATTDALVSNPVLNFAKRVGAKYITESLDLWPDNFVDYGLLNRNNPIMRYLFWRAKRNYSKSDANVFSWDGCYKYFEEKKWTKRFNGPIDESKLFYINNGVDLNDFENWKLNNCLEDEDLQSNIKRITYIGSIRLVNNLLQFIKAAELFKERKDILFLIYGDGYDRESLIQYCSSHNMSNVKFKAKWTDPKYVPFILSRSYINILNYISSDFARYGISSSKMFQYMASGKPILCNINIYNSPITSEKIGISRELKNEQSYAEALKNLLEISEIEYFDMCNRALSAAKKFDYKYLTEQLVKVIEIIKYN